MMRTKLTVIFLLVLMVTELQSVDRTTFVLDPDLQLHRIRDNVYIHISYMTADGFSRFPSNGLIYIDGEDCVVIDTPVNDRLSRILIDWLADSLHVRVQKVIGTHWHNDCIGGLAAFHRNRVPSFALPMTCEFAREKQLTIPQNALQDQDSIILHEKEIVCRYFGPGHTPDNIVVWLPAEHVLFAGCLVKSIGARGLGNTADAVVDQWDVTVDKLKNAFPAVEIVIPGHGPSGGPELFDHTITLVRTAKNSLRTN